MIILDTFINLSAFNYFVLENLDIESQERIDYFYLNIPVLEINKNCKHLTLTYDAHNYLMYVQIIFFIEKG